MHRAQAFLITGTDTEVGKTLVSCALLRLARRQGYTAVGMKPIAAGVGDSGDNEDVEQLMAASGIAVDRTTLNPYCFREPIAPHIAADKEHRAIHPEIILEAFRRLTAQADIVIVEGVGGFRVPLGDDYDTADLAVELNVPVILVVGLRLGCLNHALLTAEAIRARGLSLVGWIANCVDPSMTHWRENLQALETRLPCPLLGTLPHLNPTDPSTPDLITDQFVFTFGAATSAQS